MARISSNGAASKAEGRVTPPLVLCNQCWKIAPKYVSMGGNIEQITYGIGNL